jgi:hypothetical protein
VVIGFRVKYGCRIQDIDAGYRVPDAVGFRLYVTG